ncbi:MAG: YggU family protein, partial [Euryarchaeota archaeon]|nr:YggU family protein [Euryarchaeota archaeon]
MDIELQPAASNQGIVGINEWRKRLQVRVLSPAQKGAANKELLTYLASIFSISSSNISIEFGMKERKKTIAVSSISISDIISIIEEQIG